MRTMFVLRMVVGCRVTAHYCLGLGGTCTALTAASVVGGGAWVWTGCGCVWVVHSCAPCILLFVCIVDYVLYVVCMSPGSH
jgi:hypothetical protein